MRPADPPVPPHRYPGGGDASTRGSNARPNGAPGATGAPHGNGRPPSEPPPTTGLAGADGFASRAPRTRDAAATTGSTPTTSTRTTGSATTGSTATTATTGAASPGRHRRGGTGPGRDEEDEAGTTGSATGPGRRRAVDGKTRKNGKPKRKGSFWRELPLLIVVAIVLTFVIQTFLARIYVIPSASMERTLHGCNGCNNDRVAVDKVSYRFSDPSPGDVVVFRGPPSWGDNGEVSNERSGNVLVRGLQGGLSLLGLAPPDEKDFVKRVIATGGQTVQCCDAENRVLVDGQPLTEPYLYFQPNLGRTQQDFAPVVVPQGQLWVMGDNRNNSADARVHGPISITDVIGKARVIVLPVGRWSGVPDTDPQARVSALSELGAPGWADGLAPVAGMVGAVPLVGLSRCLRRRVLVGGSAGDRGSGDDPEPPDLPAR